MVRPTNELIFAGTGILNGRMDFYVTLPSTVQSNPGNTSARFTTHLPQTLQFRRGKDFVGLTSLIYPFSFTNMPEPVGYTVQLEQTSELLIHQLPAGDYRTPESLLNVLEPTLDTPGAFNLDTGDDYSSSIKFSIDNGHMQLWLEPGVVQHLEMDQSLAYMLGFEQASFGPGRTEARKTIDYFNNISTIFAYSDIADYSILGDTKSQLLQVCPLTGEPGRMQQQFFNPVQYHPVARETVDSITIELMTEFDKPFPFNWGSTVVTLHFKSF